jgi:hypothetical protein
MKVQEVINEEFKNIVVPPKVTPASTTATSGVSLDGRNPTSLNQVTHAYRNMSPSELQHSQQKGAFLPNPNADRANGWNTNHKYWSSGDTQGHFGRDWKNYSGNVTVRVPIDKVLPTTPVNINHAEVLDKTTGKWSSLQASTTPTKGGSYTSRMSGDGWRFSAGGGGTGGTGGGGRRPGDDNRLNPLKLENAELDNPIN